MKLMTTPQIHTPQIETDIKAGIDAIRSAQPTDPEARDKAIAAGLELQLRKAQVMEIGKVKLTGWLSIVAFVVVVGLVAWKVDIPDCIRAWKCDKAQTVEPSE